MTTNPSSHADDTEERSPAARRSSRGRRGGRSGAAERYRSVDRDDGDGPALVEDDEAPRAPRRRSTARRSEAAEDTRSRSATGDAGDATMTAILRQLEVQNEQLRKLVDLQQEMLRHNGKGGGGETAMAAPRVGVFVDSANIELAAERARKRIDWHKAMDMLTKDRRLVRAVAYSPIHDDPGVSMETQRFVEPFLDRGFKIVTKPLKRFADGSIKANVDIELALDLLAMCDRLDVVCLVSGDGDFQHLVETVQERGLRVEVAGLGGSVAANLRKAADLYVDLDPATVSASRGGGRN